MGPVRSRGSAPKAVTGWSRVSAVGAVAALVGVVVVVVLVSAGGSAGAAPTQQSFAPVHVPVNLTAVGPDGSSVSVPVLVVDSSFLPPGQLAPQPLPSLPAGERYFHIWLQPQDPVGGGTLVPLNFPADDASLVTSSGTVPAAGSDPGPSLDAQLYFPVADTITRATLMIGASTVTTVGSGDTPVSYGLEPASIDFVTASATPPVPAQGSTTPPTTLSGGNPGALSGAAGTSSSVGVGVGIGLGAVVVIGIALATAVSIRRRRAFYKADREGRVVLSGPPALLAGATLPIGAALPSDRQAIVVKLLGALELEGTKRRVTAGPLLEIIVFLALNPGKSFTSVQLRESIWGLGRQPIKSQTFRSYMMQLRRAFGPGVVVTDVYRYQLTSAVTSDWDQFQAALRTDEILDGTEAALSQVRGPVLHGSFDGKKNSPFSWAVGIANDIEDQVTNVAAELAIACIESGDPGRAASAISQGLLCSESNLRLRTLDLEVGVALGGLHELGRRLAAAQAAVATFPKDVAELEQAATQLGWVAPISG